MNLIILLNCSILGHDIKHIFGAKISSNKSVSDLKNAIKKKMQNKLGHINAHELDIWKVGDCVQHTHHYIQY